MRLALTGELECMIKVNFFRLLSPWFLSFCIFLLLSCFSGKLNGQTLNTTSNTTNSLSLMTNSQNNSMKLTPPSMHLMNNTSELMDLFNLQEQSLENLEIQWNLMETQLKKLENNNKELENQLNNSLQNTKDLESQLTEIQNTNKEIEEYNKELLNKLANTNQKYRNTIAASIICGTALGIGVTLVAVGAVEEKYPMLYSGVGIGTGSIAVWGIGKILSVW